MTFEAAEIEDALCKQFGLTQGHCKFKLEALDGEGDPLPNGKYFLVCDIREEAQAVNAPPPIAQVQKEQVIRNEAVMSTFKEACVALKEIAGDPNALGDDNPIAQDFLEKAKLWLSFRALTPDEASNTLDLAVRAKGSKLRALVFLINQAKKGG